METRGGGAARWRATGERGAAEQGFARLRGGAGGRRGASGRGGGAVLESKRLKAACTTSLASLVLVPGCTAGAICEEVRPNV
jgi:hypothetical protein